MKDLKHYFTENVKACEAGSNGDARQVTRELVEASVDGETVIPEATTRRKRGRVKIKISQTNADERVCDIVESKNDSIDKTPSPFTAGCCRDVGTDESTKHDTPRRSSSLPRKAVKDLLVKAALRGRSSPSDEPNSGDENDNSIANSEKKNGGKNSSPSVDGRNVQVESASETRADVSTVEREESNAFQVLMTRKKPIQYAVPAPLSPEDEELAARVARESKLKVKQNREKLVALADKKGYSKRKLGEMEEAEKIERRLEKRARVFRVDGKREEDEEKSPSSGRRVMPGSLHNYFSKATPEQKEKELTAVSTLVVKAEVHAHDCINEGEARGTAEEKPAATTPKADAREAMEMINDIQILESENLGSAAADAGEARPSNQVRKKKPRWSLRINLQCKDQDEQADPIVQTDDKLVPGRRESKPRKSKVKLANYENEGSESDTSNVKITKKRKSASSAQKNKTPRSKVDAAPLDLCAESLPSIVNLCDESLPSIVNLCDESLPIIVDVVLSNKTEAVRAEEPEIIVINETKRQTSGKLAPLFVKKQKPDPAVLEARRLFLQSVPAENGNQRTERRVPIAGVPFLPFPTISHVAQDSGESSVEASPLGCKFPMRKKCPFAPTYNLNEFKSVISLENGTERKSQDRTEMTKGNLEEVLAEIESRCPDAREIWKRISTTTKGEERRKSPKRKSKKRKSNEKKIESILAEEKIDHDGIWTDKYRPMSSGEIVGNEDAARKLHAWLNGWKTPLRGEDNSSGDEFYSSDCSYASDSNQVAVLLGPHGSGKTASVYAIANELGYSVLEVNASSKRAGKKLLKELEEATKSHRIKKSEGISLLPRPKEKKTTPQNSLILVEDVDLIFEEDEGFITATCQLASNTKRPIVMTGRDTCLHLNRMAPQQLRIYYQATAGSRVSALLELITLAESGYRLPQPCLDRLLQNGDLRKALLQLQYLLLSGQPRASEVPTNCHRSLWQDMRRSLYKPAIRATKKKLPKKNLVNSEKPSLHPEEKSVVTGLANDLETLSFLTTLIEVDDPTLDVMSLKFEPSVSLVENTHTYSNVTNTSAEIAKWLRDRTMDGKGSNDPGENDLQNVRQLSLKKELNAGVNLALSQVSPLNLDGRIMTLDYLPTLRAICRAEDLKISTNSKRGNRFFHYLQNLRLPSTSTKPNILAAACKMMRDKKSES